MEHIQFKNSLESFVSENDIISRIVIKIKALPEFNSLKLDVELTLYICKCIVNEFQLKTSEQIKALVVKCICQIHTFTPSEIKILDGQIQFLIDHKKVIPISKIKSLYKSSSSWVLKKFG